MSTRREELDEFVEIAAVGLRIRLDIHAKTPGAVAMEKIADQAAEFEGMSASYARTIDMARALILETTPNIGIPFAMAGELALKLDALAVIDDDLARTSNAVARAA